MSSESIVQSRFLQLGERAIEYRSLPARRSGLPTLVLLHEGLGCLDQWRDFPERLGSMTGCAVLAYSRQGYGRSSPVYLPRPLNYLWEDGPGELGQVLDALKLDDVLLLGHSDGGSIVLAYAARDDARVRGSITLAPHVLVEDRTLQAIRLTTAQWAHGPLREKLARHHGSNVEGAFHGWSDSWLHPAFSLAALVARLRDIRQPLLVIQGREDPYATSAQLTTISDHVGALCRCVLLDDCQHFPQREATDRTLRLISGFVATLLSGEAAQGEASIS